MSQPGWSVVAFDELAENMAYMLLYCKFVRAFADFGVLGDEHALRLPTTEISCKFVKYPRTCVPYITTTHRHC